MVLRCFARICLPTTIALSLIVIANGCGASFEKDPVLSNPDSDNDPDPGADPTCPSHFAMVPANATLGTSAFCIAQYEMKAETNAGSDVFDSYTVGLDETLHKPESRPGGLPWVRITQANAMLECASLGAEYSLITAPQWAAVSRNIESVASNWSSGVVGTGTLYTNHSDNAASGTAIADGHAVAGSLLLSAGDGSDPYVGTGNASGDAWGAGKEQRRTLTLSTGEVVWDLAGNARDKVAIDSAGSSLSFTGPGVSNFFDPNSATISSAVSTMIVSGGGTFSLNWLTPATGGLSNAVNSIGRIYIQSNGRVGKLLSRGGNFSPANSPGIFAGDLDNDAGNVSSSASFRCVKSVD